MTFFFYLLILLKYIKKQTIIKFKLVNSKIFKLLSLKIKTKKIDLDLKSSTVEVKIIMKIKLVNDESRKKIERLNSRLKVLTKEIKGSEKLKSSYVNAQNEE
jgi:hypothetical protein